MNRTNTRIPPLGKGLKLVLLLVLPSLSISQGVRRDYSVMGMPGRNSGEAPSPKRAHDRAFEQRLPSPAGWKPPATPLRIASTYVVTNANDAGVGSFRGAIDSANANPGLDVITFNIPGGGPQTISLLSALPTITGPVIIDGWTQPGFTGTPIIELNGQSAGANINGLVLTGGNSKVRGLVINRFAGAGGNGMGIALIEVGGDTIEGNYIGTNIAGTVALPNTGAGIGIFGTATRNLIGGATPQSRNVISGNGLGIGTNGIAGEGGENVIRGNYIGVNAAGTVVLGNSENGVYLNTPHDTIGGLVAGARNVISDNGYPGIFIDVYASGAVVQGNYIGTDFTGMLPFFGNTQNGILINEASHCIIGDPSSGGRNIISGNGYPGIYIYGATATANTVYGNYIGANAAGTGALGNSNGIYIDNAPNNTVGGVAPGARNVISGNPFPGIYVSGAAATGNKIVNNYIGTNAAGSAALPNSAGIVIDGAPGNVIGGAATEEGNLISGNLLYGAQIRSAGATGNCVRGNFIGTDYSGTRDLGNGRDGVIINASQDSVISNVIAFNHGSGVFDSSGTQSPIAQNSMFSNASLGIDLAPRGLAKNDFLDSDDGPNHLQNFPLLDSATVRGSDVTLHGRLNSRPVSSYQIEFFQDANYHPSHFGEGQSPLDPRITVTTDLAGNARFDTTISLYVVGGGNFITATATDDGGNTSEFSQALCLSDSDGDGILDSWETQGWGIDVNSDSTIDLDLYARGARPNHKDLFVEIDAMTGMAPQPTTLDPVVYSFATAPANLVQNPDGTGGIRLHYQLDETDIQQAPWPNWWHSFDSLKQIYFGTRAERMDPDSQFILAAKKLVCRYCIFGYIHAGPDTKLPSGDSENPGSMGGNDFMVTLGPWSPPGGTEDDKAGSFMHELGHTLGLNHGGADGIKYKPNYISIMNYTWQFKFQWAPSFWSLNYSIEALSTLDESNLDETIGFNSSSSSPYRIMEVPFSGPGRDTVYARLMPHTPVDWNHNGVIDNTATVAVDLNIFNPLEPTSPGQSLTSQTDWDKLRYNFRNSPAFFDLGRTSPLADSINDEMTLETFNFLNSLPPPKPSGQFVMDGQLDTSAVLLASNAGISLYARYKAGQLYVATNSAPSQGGDMVIFISDTLRSLRAAPLGKSGQVSGWSVVLTNRSSDNSVGWYDAAAVPLTNITVDTAGAVLEGVIDVELLYGRDPANLFIAVGKYSPSNGGALLEQVPVGNGDGNIDPLEFFQFLGTPPPPPSVFVQQGNKLVGTGAVNSNVGVQQGNSVALSSDGNTAIVGASADNGYVGAAWIYTRNGDVWSQQGAKLVGLGATGTARQGYSVALSSDGNTAVVGGFRDNNYVGAAWVFTRSSNAWSQMGNKLAGSGVVGAAQQGWSVALSYDGNTAIVGGSSDNNGVGAAWVFKRTDSVWTQQGNKLVGTGAVNISPYNVYQGTSVALSSDGNTAIVGAPNDSAYTGAAWVYTRTGNVWNQQGGKLVGSGAVNNPYRARQGSSVALSSDGNTALVGGIEDDSAKGAVWVFTRTGGVWTQQESKLVGSGAVNTPYGASQGYSVALSSDGNTAITGGYYDNNGTGATWVFRRSGTVWSQQGGKLVGTGAVNAPYPALQGYSVALASDGNTAMVGGPNDAQNVGAAWVFTHDVPLPIQLANFTATIVNGGHVRLDWTTLSEINNYGFEAQRGPGAQGEFQTIPNSFVPGHGTTNEPHTYAYTDTTTSAGQWRYRLKQTDLDGTIHFGPEVAVVVTDVGETQIPKAFALQQNYPNPFNPSTTIRYELPEAAHVTLKIWNTLGEEVATLVDRVEEAGYKSVVWRGENVASGVYFYRIVATAGRTNFTDVRKMLILK